MGKIYNPAACRMAAQTHYVSEAVAVCRHGLLGTFHTDLKLPLIISRLVCFIHEQGLSENHSCNENCKIFQIS